MKKKPRKRHAAFDRGIPVLMVSDRRLLVVDQEVLRSKVSSKCRIVMERLEVAQSEWERFTEEDQPAFTRWNLRYVWSVTH